MSFYNIFLNIYINILYNAKISIKGDPARTVYLFRFSATMTESVSHITIAVSSSPHVLPRYWWDYVILVEIIVTCVTCCVLRVHLHAFNNWTEQERIILVVVFIYLFIFIFFMFYIILYIYFDSNIFYILYLYLKRYYSHLKIYAPAFVGPTDSYSWFLS